MAVADFRKGNDAAIKKVRGQFIELCRILGLATIVALTAA